MMGRPFVFERPGGLKYFYSELVDSFVENKNSDIKITCSDLHIFCHNVSVQDKGQEQVQQISSRSTECIFAGPRIDLMSTKFLFYIVKGFGLKKRGMRAEFFFSAKESTNSGSKYFKPPSQNQMVAPSCFDTSCYEKLEKF
jgi:hypothetical protein